MSTAQLFSRIAKNDQKIQNLLKSIDKQVLLYQLAFGVNPKKNNIGSKQQSYSITDDTYQFVQKMTEFKNQSEKFVNDLVQIKKNTLVILENFPTKQVWLHYQNDREWNNFVDQFVPKNRTKSKQRLIDRSKDRHMDRSKDKNIDKSRDKNRRF